MFKLEVGINIPLSEGNFLTHHTVDEVKRMIRECSSSLLRIPTRVAAVAIKANKTVHVVALLWESDDDEAL
jgi:hypothetical protein